MEWNSIPFRLHKSREFHEQISDHQPFERDYAHGVTYKKATKKKNSRPMKGRYDNNGYLPSMHTVQKSCHLKKVINTSCNINTMVRELEGNLGKYGKGESEMLKPDVWVDP